MIVDQGRYLAEHIPGAQYLELASGGHWPWAAADADRFLDRLEFLTGAPRLPAAMLAGPDEVVVSSTVKDLVAGTGIRFEDRGIHALKACPRSGTSLRSSHDDSQQDQAMTGTSGQKRTQQTTPLT